MQIKRHRPDPQLPAILAAVRDRMRHQGHSQTEVAKLTGLSQGEISKILRGQRKRLTKPVQVLCKYAHYNAQVRHDAANDDPAGAQLAQTVSGLIGENPAVADVLAQILRALAPILRHYQPSLLSTAGGDE